MRGIRIYLNDWYIYQYIFIIRKPVKMGKNEFQ